ncbi:MAG: response regulator [Deltaproteobacteria bacterium]|nr:response regulator [Deltaproteobacteria bacterium]
MNERKHTILLVDDEENILNAIKRLLRKENYEILTASSVNKALKLLEENQVHLIVSDQRMPEISGTDFLATVKENYPDVIRIILTGYMDVDAISESVNKGQTYKFLLKPWDDQTFKLEIKQALDYYDLQEANKELHRKVLEQNKTLREVNENLETLIQRRTEELVIQNQTLELSREILDHLPVAIIGVSKEGMIVLANQETQRLPLSGKTIRLGEDVSDYFGDGVGATIAAALNIHTPQVLSNCWISGKPYEIHCTPLSGSFHGRGVILSIMPMHSFPPTAGQA